MVKHKQYNELGDPYPGGYSWGFSLVALVGFFAVLLWGQMAFTGLRYARLQARFSKLAGQGENLYRLVDDQKFQPITSQHRDAFKALLPVIAMVNKGKLGEAAKILQRKDTPTHPLIVHLRDKIQELADADANFQYIEDEEEGSGTLRASLEKSYQEVHGELGHSLNGSFKSPDSVDLKNGFYRAGVLASLPMIENVPDGIDSLEQLETFSTKLRSSSDRERKTFYRNLDLLRARSTELKPQIEDLLAQVELRQNKIKLLSQSRKASIKEAQGLLAEVLPEFTRLALAPSLVDSYRQLAVFGSQFGMEFPTLKLS